MALYRGRRVSLNKVMRGDVKKFKVFVKKGSRVVKVNFGDKKMSIKKTEVISDLQSEDVTKVSSNLKNAEES